MDELVKSNDAESVFVSISQVEHEFCFGGSGGPEGLDWDIREIRHGLSIALQQGKWSRIPFVSPIADSSVTSLFESQAVLLSRLTIWTRLDHHLPIAV